LVPIDKFKPENMDRTYDYIYLISQVDPVRLKFTGEKHLKGRELYNKKFRRCPLTGKVEAIPVDPDWWSTYNIVGFCGIDGRTCPMDFYVTDGINDSLAFYIALEQTIAKGFLRYGDILVLDNAAIHRFKENVDLEEWLYTTFGIFALFLPTRSPELNPIELLWHRLVICLRSFDHGAPRSHKDAFAYAAAEVMEAFTHEDVWKCYYKCQVV
jgi:transposase